MYPNILTALPSSLGIPTGRTATLDIGELDPHARRTPYSEQLTIGVAREVSHDIAVSVDYIYLEGHDLFRTVDLNGPAAFDTTSGATRSVAAADATRPYGSPSVVPGPYDIQEGGFKQIRAVYSEGSGWYHALKLNLTKRFANRHFTSCGYAGRSENEQDDFGRRPRFRPVRLRRARGQRHPARLRRQRHLLLPWDISVSGILIARPGRRWIRWPAATSTVTASTPIDPQLRAQQFPRRVVHEFPTWPSRNRFISRRTASNCGRTLNVFNMENVTRVNNTHALNPAQPAATFFQPTAVANPRQFPVRGAYRFCAMGSVHHINGSRGQSGPWPILRRRGAGPSCRSSR